MQYSLQRQRCETAFDAVLYTVKSMKECGEDDYIDPDEEIDDLCESQVSLRNNKITIDCY